MNHNLRLAEKEETNKKFYEISTKEFYIPDSKERNFILSNKENIYKNLFYKKIIRKENEEIEENIIINKDKEYLKSNAIDDDKIKNKNFIRINI